MFLGVAVTTTADVGALVIEGRCHSEQKTASPVNKCLGAFAGVDQWMYCDRGKKA